MFQFLLFSGDKTSYFWKQRMRNPSFLHPFPPFWQGFKVESRHFSFTFSRLFYSRRPTFLRESEKGRGCISIRASRVRKKGKVELWLCSNKTGKKELNKEEGTFRNDEIRRKNKSRELATIVATRTCRYRPMSLVLSCTFTVQ